MKIHLFDCDPRAKTDPTYPSTAGSFGVVSIEINKALQKIGHYSEPDDADFVGISDGLNLSWKYKNKPAFIIHVWDVINSLTHFHLAQYQQSRPRIFGLSNQVGQLWAKYGIECPTVHGGCNVNFWDKSRKYNDKFTFLHVNFTNVRSGFDLLLRAFDLGFRGDPNVKLIVKNTEDNPKLREMIKSFNFGNIEYLTGRKSFEEMRDLYSQSHCLVNVVRHSSLGLPLLEGAACRCLPVAGDFCPSNEMVMPEYGVLIKPSKAISIREKVPELVNTYGLTDCYGNLEHTEEPLFYDYNVEEYASKLVDIYKNWDSQYSVRAAYARMAVIRKFNWTDSAAKLVEYLSD